MAFLSICITVLILVACTATAKHPQQDAMVLEETEFQQKSNNADLARQKRPIYNVAHMVNGKSQLNENWVNAANSIEADLQFDAQGNPTYFYHGIPCDCFRNCRKSLGAETYFADLKRKAQDKNQKLALFWIDLKLSGQGITDFFSSGQKLAKLISRSLFPHGEEVPINVLLGAEEIDQKNFFLGFRDYITITRPELLPKFGYDFSSTSEDVDVILNTFKYIGITENIWVGDGISNCLWRGTSRLEKILAKRDSHSSELAPFKVYAWTFDKTGSMKEYLKLGVDALIVNFPNRMNTAVAAFQGSMFLATRETDPWKRIRASEAIRPSQ